MTNADDIDTVQIEPDPDKLLAYHRQQLSAMLDGELSPDEAKFMLRRLQHDGELAACWERWQVCGDMLRGRHHALLPSNFAERVAQAIAGDAGPVAVEAEASRSPRFLRWGGGAALAASVALVAVFAARQLPDPVESSPSPAGQPVIASSAGPAPVDAGDTPATPSPIDAAPAVLATALAAAEAPRRAAERRARTQQARQREASAIARSDESAPDAMALAPSDFVAAAVEPAVVHDVFPAPPSLQPRPWPRAILPGATDSPFAAGYGRLPVLAAETDAYEPFRPRLVIDPATPARQGQPADAGGVERLP